MSSRGDHAKKCVPVVIHGDGFPCMGIGKSWGKVMDSWQWSSMLTNAKSKFCVWLIFCVHQVLRTSRNGFATLDEAYIAIAWSFDALYEGKWPTHNWKNERINYPKVDIYMHMCLPRKYMSYVSVLQCLSYPCIRMY